MKKAINLQVVLHGDGAGAELTPGARLQRVLAWTHPDLQVTVNKISPPDAGGYVTLTVYAEGEHDPRTDFAATTITAMNAAAASLADGVTAPASVLGAPTVRVVTAGADETNVVLAPRSHAPDGSGGGPPTLPPSGLRLSTKGQQYRPPRTTFRDCPAVGDGGDADVNIRKNRTDAGNWYPVELGSIRDLGWPAGAAGAPRSEWSPEDRAAVARYEGLPVQAEGWLVAAQPEGPDACNCHSPEDVDYHLWLAEAPGQDRKDAVVAEITPRVRAQHPEWSFPNIRDLVLSGACVRVSGWLLVDADQADQIGDTRATLWEIHPVLVLEVQQDDGWVMFGAQRGVGTLGSYPPATPLSAPFAGPGAAELQ